MLIDIKKGMSKINFHPHSIKRWINFFYATSVILVIIAGGIFYYFIYFYLKPENNLYEHHLINFLVVIRFAFLGLFTLMIFGVSFIWFYTYRFILEPLHNMKSLVEGIGRGQLDQTMNISAPIEMKRVSESISDLSVNIQEILLFVWNQTETILSCLENSGYNSDVTQKERSEVDVIKHKILELQNLVTKFDFYDVKMSKKKIFDGSEKKVSRL